MSPPAKSGGLKTLRTKDDHPLVSKSKPGEVFTDDLFGQTHFEKDTNDWHWRDDEEPHAIRRKMILKDHPEIRQLFGHEPLTAVLVFALCALQWFVMLKVKEASWPVWCLATWAISGTVTHTLQLANHDISHNLAFGPQNVTANIILGIIANLPTAVPSSVMFRYYHYDHHLKQGVDGEDTDIPCQMEINMFRNTFTKFLWMLMMPAFYAIRPLVVKPRPVTPWAVVNTIVILAWDAWVYKNHGMGGLGYFLFGSLIGMAFHPCAGHFIAEHFEFMQDWETYSYYGSCNFFNLMVGYHNEHHDFPKVPWTRLHKVHAIAKEYYQHLPCHDSYLRMYWHFLTDETIGPWSRVKRHQKKRA